MWPTKHSGNYLAFSLPECQKRKVHLDSSDSPDEIFETTVTKGDIAITARDPMARAMIRPIAMGVDLLGHVSRRRRNPSKTVAANATTSPAIPTHSIGAK
jgi:hypothetical protein